MSKAFVIFNACNQICISGYIKVPNRLCMYQIVNYTLEVQSSLVLSYSAKIVIQQ